MEVGLKDRLIVFRGKNILDKSNKKNIKAKINYLLLGFHCKFELSKFVRSMNFRKNICLLIGGQS